MNDIKIVDAGLLKTSNAKEIFDAVNKGVALPHARVMLVGMGNVGKSYLATRTFQRICEMRDRLPKQTPDIVILRPEDCTAWKPVVETKRGPKQIEPWVWDFAGQLVTHGMHESFLDDDGRTVYLLVLAADCTPGLATKNDEGNRLLYWIQMLRRIVGRTSPVVIVITRNDRVKSRIHPVDDPISWPNLAEPCSLRHLWISHRNYFPDTLNLAVMDLVGDFSACDHDYKIDDGLRKVITQAMVKLEVAEAKMVHPKLESLKHRVEAAFRDRTMISTAEFFTWCRKEKVKKPSTQQTLLLNLHFLGSLVYWGQLEEGTTSRPKNAEKGGMSSELRTLRRSDDRDLMTQILSPEWFKQCVYQITRKSEELDHNRKPRTWLTAEEIDRVIRNATRRVTKQQEITPLEKDVIRKALDFTMVCFRDGKHYVFPRGLADFPLSGYKKWDRWELRYDFLPEYAVARLIVALHTNGGGLVESETKGQFCHGRNAALIRYPKDAGILALVVADPDQGKMEVRFGEDSTTAQRHEVRNFLIIVLSTKELKLWPPAWESDVPEACSALPSLKSESLVQPFVPAEKPIEFKDILEQQKGAVQRDLWSYWLMVIDGPCDPGSKQNEVYSQMIALLKDLETTKHWNTRKRLIEMFKECPPLGIPRVVELEPGRTLQIPMMDAWRRNLNHAVENSADNPAALEFLNSIGLGTQHRKRAKRLKPKRTLGYPNDDFEISQDDIE